MPLFQTRSTVSSGIGRSSAMRNYAAARHFAEPAIGRAASIAEIPLSYSPKVGRHARGHRLLRQSLELFHECVRARCPGYPAEFRADAALPLRQVRCVEEGALDLAQRIVEIVGIEIVHEVAADLGDRLTI